MAKKNNKKNASNSEVVNDTTVDSSNDAANSNVEKSKRSEAEGALRFGKEMISALAMALVFIFYIIQAFKIPTGSMENSLLPGDYLLGLKFIYGAPIIPFTKWKFPGFTSPKPGDVVIFKYPGKDKKDYIKRCVAGPGQTIEINTRELKIDNQVIELPPDGKFTHGGKSAHDKIRNFSPLRIPAKGDIIKIDTCPVREFMYLRYLVEQENSGSKVELKFSLLNEGQEANDLKIDLPLRRVYKLGFLTSFFSKFSSTLAQNKIMKKVKADYGNIQILSMQMQGATVAVEVGYRGPFKGYSFDDIDNWVDLDMRLFAIVQQHPEKKYHV